MKERTAGIPFKEGNLRYVRMGHMRHLLECVGRLPHRPFSCQLRSSSTSSLDGSTRPSVPCFILYLISFSEKDSAQNGWPRLLGGWRSGGDGGGLADLDCRDHMAGVVSENVRQETQDLARLCEILLSPALNGRPSMNLVECAVIRYYASSLMDRCDAFLAGRDEQRLQ